MAMKRTKKIIATVVEPKKIQWIWKGKGKNSLKISGGKVIPLISGETFYALPKDIPMAFRDIIVPTEDVPLISVTQYEIKARLNEENQFDVVKIGTNKPINEILLTEEDAKELLKELMGE